jgi:nucleolar MIF4G domain-containing protein 1
MSRKRHTITMPGVMLDSIRDNADYETDERFTKRQKLKGPSVLHRKENRKQQRDKQKLEKRQLTKQLKEKFKQNQKENNPKNGNKKQKKAHDTAEKQFNTESDYKSSIKSTKEKGDFAVPKSKKRVSFSEQDEVREIPARGALSSETEIDVNFEKWEEEFASDSEDSEQLLSDTDEDSQDEADEQGAHNLIETLKHLKQVQRGGFKNTIETVENGAELDDEQKAIMAQLAELKGKRQSSDIRIVKEDDLDDDEISEEDVCSDNDKSNDLEDMEGLDDEQTEIMNQLAALKAKKARKGNSELRIVKEDDLDDDSVSESDAESREKEEDEEEGEDEDLDEDLDEEQKDVMSQLAALNGRKKSSGEIKIVKEDELDDDELSEEVTGSDEEQLDSEEMNSDMEEDESGEELDDDQKDVMAQLAALKGRKKSSDQIKIVKEDELDDDELSEEVTGSDEEEQLDSEEMNRDMEEDESGEELDDDQKDVMAQLAALKGKKAISRNDIRIVKETDLSDDSLDDDAFSEADVSENESREIYQDPTQYKHLSENDFATPKLDFQDDDDEMMYYAKKLGKEAKKLKRESEDDIVGGLFEGLDFMDKYDAIDDDELDVELAKDTKRLTTNEKGKKKTRSLTAEEREQLRKDEEEINYYAKKLGAGKEGLKKEGEDDFIGGLLDGLNLDFSDEEELTGTEEDDLENHSEEEEMLDALPEIHKKPSRRSEDDDDEVDSDDFDDDDDLDEDDKALLKEMYGLESSGSENDDSDLDSEEDDDRPRVKENPYMAPVDPSVIQQDQVPTGSKYIPPALRRKMAMGENSEDSEALKKLMRLVKGPFNKLSEPNMNSAISELNAVFNDNPRQFVNEAILRVVLQSVSISTPMLESFLVLYSSAIVALYKLQGIDFGAYAVQKLVEKFASEIESKERANQEILNLTGLLGYLYTLNFVSSSLIYDIIKSKLISDPSELKTDVLLKLIRSCGSKLRTDDPTALTSIIAELTKSVKENERKGIKTSTRSRFLIDTITDLKNNRLKNMENENTTKMIMRIKKQMGSINQSRNLDPIKVTLDDIENVEERGKWWLVGSAWKGNDSDNKNEKDGSMEEEVDDLSNVNEKLINNEDELSGAQDVNWMELAKQCRMNTDIRRGIFISIMSAEDFMDAFMKLEKLNLKKSQKAEIPNILMHCATMEATYNPYYSFLAKKLCDDHSMRRSFQLNLWDFIKELDDDDSSSTTILAESNDDERLWKVVNMGRFFGFLIGEGSLSLNVLRVINFLTATSDVKIFLEIMIVTILDTIAKRSEVNSFGSGKGKKSKDITYSGKLMLERVIKCDEQPLLLKGLQYFLNNKIRKSGCIKGKKQRTRVDWGITTMTSIIEELLKSQK